MEEVEDNIDLDDTKLVDKILLEDTLGMEKKGDIKLEKEIEKSNPGQFKEVEYDIDLDDTKPEDSVLLEDTPGMEKKGDAGLEEEEDEVIIINEDEIIEENNPGQSREPSEAFCNSDGTNCGEERGENIYAEKPDPKPVEDKDILVVDKDIPAEENPQKKSKQTPEQKSKSTLIREDKERKQKKDSDPSPEELQEELRAAYKSTQKKAKIKTSNIVNLEGCQKLLDQAQVRPTLGIFLLLSCEGFGQEVCQVSSLKSAQF